MPGGVRMGYRFNPPPNWPELAAGWTPPPGWQPPDTWPAPPPSWQLWLTDPAQPVENPSAQPVAGPAAARVSQPGLFGARKRLREIETALAVTQNHNHQLLEALRTESAQSEQRASQLRDASAQIGALSV